MSRLSQWLRLAVVGLVVTPIALADGGVTYTNIAEGDNAGIDYRRTRSPRDAQYRALIAEPSPIAIPDFIAQNTQQLGQKWRGAPGVALFDYDRDGDLDIYVTNGPSSANSLYSNQWIESGSVTFVDVATEAGVEAFDQDSSGVCFGDLDNDGDHDLYVLGTNELNLLFENQGDGTFHDISAASGAASVIRNPTGCSMADVNGDGLLDIVVANTYDDWNHRLPHAPNPSYEYFEHNDLFLNAGGNTFTEESAASGIESVSNMSGPGRTGAAYTWALATADYDLDGDVDLLFADNQGAPPTSYADERGWLRLYENDGSGQFTEVTQAAGLDVWGGWMGLDFSDLNCDGNLDFFATDIGYAAGGPSRWFYGQADGSFTEPGIGSMIMNPFGWGTSLFDYDNDADADIVYHGGMNIRSILIADNPGVVLRNDGECSGVFSWDDTTLLQDHRDRLVQGMAVGDLNHDGFEDIVSVADTRFIPRFFLPGVGPPFFIWGPTTGSPFDAVATFEAIYAPFPPGNWTLLGPFLEQPDGDLAVELNSADNGNGWIEITALGSAGILSGDDLVNRDGIGAVVSFTPEDGKTSMRPIIGGSSYASQDALAANFGLGSANQGTVDVLWPGGVRNRLYDVANGERLLMPHIPCSYDANWKNFGKYNSCVMKALNSYKNAGLISSAERNRLRDSARRAYEEVN